VTRFHRCGESPIGAAYKVRMVLIVTRMPMRLALIEAISLMVPIHAVDKLRPGAGLSGRHGTV